MQQSNVFVQLFKAESGGYAAIQHTLPGAGSCVWVEGEVLADQKGGLCTRTSALKQCMSVMHKFKVVLQLLHTFQVMHKVCVQSLKAIQPVAGHDLVPAHRLMQE